MKAGPRFQRGEVVVLQAQLELGGGQVVTEPTQAAGQWWYRIKFANSTRMHVEDELEPIGDPGTTPADYALRGEWGSVAAFRQALVMERFQRRESNRSTIYAFRNQKVLFEPHQYKPLLKFLDSADRRLLIADEVGLGKTIEAGLILAELRARLDISRILVVCPSRLRDKWRRELNGKFGFDFDILGGQEIRNWLVNCRNHQGPRALRAIISQQTLRQAELREEFLAETQRLDLVIVDEAHHAKNPGTLTTQLVQGLGQVADAFLLMTATPVSMGNRDLFTLLQALRPHEFTDPQVFYSELDRHASLRHAAQLTRTQDNKRLEELAKSIRAGFAINADRFEAPVSDPLAAQVLQTLKDSPPTHRRQWLELERRIEELHILAPILTRTRKRDVQEHAATRLAVTHHCVWSDEEQRAYCRLLGVDDAQPWPQTSIGLGMVQRYRWGASCLPAALQQAGSLDPSDAYDDLGCLEEEEQGAPSLDKPTLPPVPTGLGVDAKLRKLVEILKQIDREDPGAKVILFTFFRGTSLYLAQHLTRLGWPTCRIAGDVPSDPNNPDKDLRGQAVHQFEHDPSIRVLVSTEVGSEGLDFQFCHTLINYDLPWNPMVVEQRIGRIDRFGQRSDKIFIHNLVVTGTVEERVLERLYSRIGIFRRSIGDLDQLLGEQMRELNAAFFRGELTPAQAQQRVEQAANAIETRRLHFEELERKHGELLGHEDRIRDEVQRIQDLGRHVSGHALQHLVSGFLERFHTTIRLHDAEPGLHRLSVDSELCQLVGEAVGHEGSMEMRRLMRMGEVRITFDGQLAFEQQSRGVQLLNPEHPLVRAAMVRMEQVLTDPKTRVTTALLPLSGETEPAIPAGWTYLVTFRQDILSLRPRTLLLTLGWSDAGQNLVEAETAERMLHLVQEAGLPQPKGQPLPRMPQVAWSAMEAASCAATSVTKKEEALENEARRTRRHTQVEAEFDRVLKNIDIKIATAKREGRSERILNLFQAQRSRQLEERQRRLAELDKGKAVSVSLSEPLTICAVHVERGVPGHAADESMHWF